MSAVYENSGLQCRIVFPCRCTDCMARLADWTLQAKEYEQQRLSDEYQSDQIAEHTGMQIPGNR